MKALTYIYVTYASKHAARMSNVFLASCVVIQRSKLAESRLPAQMYSPSPEKQHFFHNVLQGKN